MSAIELTIPDKTDPAELERLAQLCVPQYVNELISEHGQNLNAIAHLLKTGRLRPNHHRISTCVDRPDEEYLSLLMWACWNGTYELIALLLLFGADPDAAETHLRGKTPRVYVHELSRISYMSEQSDYTLALMGEACPSALEHAVRKGYFFGVQRLARAHTPDHCFVAICTAEREIRKRKTLMAHYPCLWEGSYATEDDLEWAAELRHDIRTMERITTHLRPLIFSRLALLVATGTHARLGKDSPLAVLHADLLECIVRYV